MLAKISNIISAIGAIKGLLTLIQPITDLIHLVEQPGIPGAQKKAAVMDLIKAAIGAAESAFKINLPDELVLGFSESIIDVVVSIMNLLGRFTHSTGELRKTVLPPAGTDAGAKATASLQTAAARAADYTPEGPG